MVLIEETVGRSSTKEFLFWNLFWKELQKSLQKILQHYLKHKTVKWTRITCKKILVICTTQIVELLTILKYLEVMLKFLNSSTCPSPCKNL